MNSLRQRFGTAEAEIAADLADTTEPQHLEDDDGGLYDDADASPPTPDGVAVAPQPEAAPAVSGAIQNAAKKFPTEMEAVALSLLRSSNSSVRLVFELEQGDLAFRFLWASADVGNLSPGDILLVRVRTDDMAFQPRAGAEIGLYMRPSRTEAKHVRVSAVATVSEYAGVDMLVFRVIASRMDKDGRARDCGDETNEATEDELAKSAAADLIRQARIDPSLFLRVRAPKPEDSPQ